MSKRIFVIIMMLMVSLPFSACSKVGDAISPDYTPLSQNSQNQDNPAEFSSTIELNPMGEDVDGIFTFGDTTVQGIEVRIDGELADITGEGGEFTVPSIIGNDHTISFSIMGETIHSQPFSPAARFAQDAPDPGPGVMAGSVNDENGPLPGALVVVIKGSVYAFAFTGQYGQYYLAGAPSGNCLAVVLSEFHNTVFQAVNIPSDGTPVEKNFFAPVNLTLGRITGRVMSPGIGAVPGAYVKYEALGVMREDLSNIFGMFDMPAVPVSNGNLEVSRDGFYPSENSFDVHAGLNPAPVFIQVIEQSVVHGVVVNSNNEPVDGAVVRLTIFNKEGELPAVYGMYSGPGGYFLFEDLLPGPFALQAFMPGKVPATSFGTVLPGSNIEKVLVLSDGSGGSAHGWVINWQGEPINGAIVQLKYIGTEIGELALTNDAGYWELTDVPYGACEVIAMSSEYLPGVSWEDIYPDDPLETITMCFPVLDTETGALGGTVMSGGSPAKGALVWAFNANDPGRSHMMLADEDGEYYFPSITPGTTGGWAFIEGLEPVNGFVEVVAGDLVVLDFEF